jgi:hypothetical protein
MIVSYKDYQFPSNPQSIEISLSSNCNSSAIFDGNSVTENVSINPIVVTGSGEIYGDSGDEYCSYLGNMLKDKSSGWLLLPSAMAIKAYFTKFKFSRDNKKNSVSYSFEFTEDCTDRSAKKQFKYTIALDNENAFDIANRCDVSVNDIMSLNDFGTPFEIISGSKVVIR